MLVLTVPTSSRVNFLSVPTICTPAERISVLGPAEAPLAVIRGQFRWRLLVKAPRDIDLQGYLRAWMDALPQLKGDLRLVLDVDPYSFL